MSERVIAAVCLCKGRIGAPLHEDEAGRDPTSANTTPLQPEDGKIRRMLRRIGSSSASILGRATTTKKQEEEEEGPGNAGDADNAEDAGNVSPPPSPPSPPVVPVVKR